MSLSNSRASTKRLDDALHEPWQPDTTERGLILPMCVNGIGGNVDGCAGGRGCFVGRVGGPDTAFSGRRKGPMFEHM